MSVSRWWAATVVVVLCHGVSAGFSEEDDAGSGADAPDLFAASLLVGPGHYQGNLSGTDDLADSYGFLTNELQVVRIDFSLGENVSMKIVDSHGTVRGCYQTPGDGRFSAVTDPFGTWEVRFDRGYCAGMISALPRNTATMPESSRVSYAFAVGFENHEHFERLEFPAGTNLTFELGLMAEQYGRLELDILPNHAGAGPWAMAQAIDIRRAGLPAERYMFAGIFNPYLGLGDPTIWSTGTLPDEALVTIPVTAVIPPLGDPPRRVVIDGTPAESTTINYGLVNTVGFRATGWLVWDDTIQLDIIEGTSVVHKAMHDFQVDGAGFQIGPWVHAERATTTYDAGAPLEVLYVNGRAPRLDPNFPPVQLAEPRIEVVAPDGARTSMVDEARFWHEGELGNGRWQIEAHDIDGAWGETFVVVGIKFPF